jgi:hypothetical protein
MFYQHCQSDSYDNGQKCAVILLALFMLFSHAGLLAQHKEAGKPGEPT